MTLLNEASSSAINSESLRILRFSIVHGKIPNTPVSAWMEKINWFITSSQCRELVAIDGELMEFE